MAPETIISVVRELCEHVEQTPQTEQIRRRAALVLQIVEAERDAIDRERDAEETIAKQELLFAAVVGTGR